MSDVTKGVVGTKVDNMIETHQMLARAGSVKAAKQVRYALVNYIRETVGEILTARESGDFGEDDPNQQDMFEEPQDSEEVEVPETVGSFA